MACLPPDIRATSFFTVSCLEFGFRVFLGML
jgi:hypothetical protein